MAAMLTAVLFIAGTFVLPQVVGFMVGRARRGHRRRSWEWPVVAAAFFATGWYLFWCLGTGPGPEHGHATCGAAGALLMIPLMLLTPFHAILGAVLQVVLRRGTGTRG